MDRYARQKGFIYKTYKFDAEQWYENEHAALETQRKKGDLTGIEFEKARSDNLNGYEEMVARLDGTYQLPKLKVEINQKGNWNDIETGSEGAKKRIQRIG